MNKKILVIGSKPDAKLPKHDFTKIYCANAAVSRAKHYKNAKVCNIVAHKQIYKDTVINSIREGEPDLIIWRLHNNNEIFPNELTKISHGTASIKVLRGEENFTIEHYFLGKSIWKGIAIPGRLHFKFLNICQTLFTKHKVFATSTGLFSILYALYHNPEAEIVVSGIGLQGGTHFNSTEIFKDEHAIRDIYAANKISEIHKSRVTTTNLTFSEVAEVKLWQGEWFVDY